MKITPEDELFSKFIRKRALLRCEGCEYCGKQKLLKELDCHHFVKRHHNATRFDPENCVGVCKGCHWYLTDDDDANVEFFKKRLGSEAYEKLKIRGHAIKKLTKLDREEIRVYWKEKIKELDNVG